MLIRKTPKNKDKYIKVDDEVSFILHQNGFKPKYIDGLYIYYAKSKNLEKFIEESLTSK